MLSGLAKMYEMRAHNRPMDMTIELRFVSSLGPRREYQASKKKRYGNTRLVNESDINKNTLFAVTGRDGCYSRSSWARGLWSSGVVRGKESAEKEPREEGT